MSQRKRKPTREGRPSGGGNDGRVQGFDGLIQPNGPSAVATGTEKKGQPKKRKATTAAPGGLEAAEGGEPPLEITQLDESGRVRREETPRRPAPQVCCGPRPLSPTIGQAFHLPVGASLRTYRPSGSLFQGHHLERQRAAGAAQVTARQAHSSDGKRKT